jgi:hypothetical protein
MPVYQRLVCLRIPEDLLRIVGIDITEGSPATAFYLNASTAVRR